jgi:hypothetical protein
VEKHFPILPARRGTEIPLSFAQERFWYRWRDDPASARYNTYLAMSLRGQLSMSALERAFNEVLRRHEILRTNFAVSNDRPIQVIKPSLTLPLLIEDFSAEIGRERYQKLLQRAAEEVYKPLDLTNEPLVKLMLLRLAEEDYVLLLRTHHIIWDAWTTLVFMREMAVSYRAFSVGAPSPLPELPFQYADYTLWQRERLRGEILENQMAYWRRQLGGNLPVLEMPTDKPRPRVPTFNGADSPLHIPEPLAARLRALSRRQRCTLFMTLLAAFKTLLHKYTGQQDIIVGCPFANRDRTELESLIGCFTNSIALRTDMSGNPQFAELLGRVRKTTLEAYNNRELPLALVLKETHPQIDWRLKSLYRVVFAFQNVPEQNIELPELAISRLRLPRKTAQYDIVLTIFESGALGGIFIYNTDLFTPQTVDAMIRDFQSILESVVENPEERILGL